MLELNKIQYSVDKMPPRQQFHVLRRLAPLLGALGGAVVSLLDDSKPKEEVIAELVAGVGPLADALALMPDEQLDYVLDACLLHVRRLDVDQNWHPIYLANGKTPLRKYVDIDAGMELRLVSEVIKENLSGFFGQLSGGSASSLSAPR